MPSSEGISPLILLPAIYGKQTDIRYKKKSFEWERYTIKKNQYILREKMGFLQKDRLFNFFRFPIFVGIGPVSRFISKMAIIIKNGKQNK